MKVIDLLNKIANGEEVPTFIKVRDSVFGASYKFDGKDLDFQLDNEEYYLSDYICKGGLSLNDEVEIIEEDKKIEHIENYVDFANLNDAEKFDYLYEMETRIMDYINKEK